MALIGSGGLGSSYGIALGPNSPIRDNLIAWYDFRHELQGDTNGFVNQWGDISGDDRHAADYNVEASGRGDMKGFYWELDGTNEYFRETGWPTGLSQYTLEFWGKADDFTVDYMLDGRASDDTGDWWLLKEQSSYDSNYRDVARVNWSNGYTNWHQVVAVQGSVGANLYINGEYQHGGYGGNTWNTAQMTIGTDYNGGNYWNGKMGIIRVYNTALSANQIKHNWHCDASKFARYESGI